MFEAMEKLDVQRDFVLIQVTEGKHADVTYDSRWIGHAGLYCRSISIQESKYHTATM